MSFGISYSLFFILLTTSLPSLAKAQAGCHENGIFLPNGTSWFPEPCIECQCQSYVTMCNKLKCSLIECQADEDLISLPHECCPKCSMKMKSCVEHNLQFEHGATWALSPCVDCQCYNGTISCERKHCPASDCTKQQVEVQSAGDCCPRCISSGRQCTVGNEIHSDGSIWTLLPCTQCRCEDGITHCYVAQCPSISCPLNYTLELLPGKCCPTCHGNPCVSNKKLYSSGDKWNEGSCSHCSCNAGQFHCYEEVCADISCPSGQQLFKTDSKCCHSCVKEEGWCQLQNGDKVPPGTEVELPKMICTANEEVKCVCSNSSVLCKPIRCQKTHCGTGMIMQPNDTAQCKCPKCVPDMNICYFDRRLRKDGETWQSGCRLCSCQKGEVNCYNPICPTCSEGLSVETKLVDSCCPKCLTVKCPKNCISCTSLLHEGGSAIARNSSSATTCRACRIGYLLQDGQCVKTCSTNRMTTASGRCVPCHPTCQSCSDITRVHCTSCLSSLFLMNGECINDCGAGYFSQRGTCRTCHESCQECSGPGITECQVCHGGTKLLNGRCIDACPSQFVARDGICEKIPTNCKIYGVKNDCLQCQGEFYNEQGICVKNCQKNFFLGSSNQCQECHSSCATCKGPTIDSCTSCPNYLLQVGNKCLPSCPSAMFREGTECLACHESCSQCQSKGKNRCLACREMSQSILPDEAQVVKMNQDIYGKCVDSCPRNYKSINGLCVEAMKGCKEWKSIDPKHCKKCRKGFLMQNNKCVIECSPGFYESQDHCLECSAHCASCFGKGSEECITCPPWASLHQTTDKENQKNVSKCLTKCRKKYYFYQKHSSCEDCDDSCRDCATSAISKKPTCLECTDSQFFREDERCVKSCSEGFYVSEIKMKCDRCHHSCQSCFGPHPDQCKTCFPPTKLSSENTCNEINCGSSLQLSPNDTCSTTCIDNNCRLCTNAGSHCIECKPGMHLLFGKCVHKCPKMFFANPENKMECQECHWSCGECLGPSENDCTICGPSSKRQGSSCVTTCSKAYYEDKDECKLCQRGCKDCMSNDSCNSCLSPYFWQNGSCSASCKNGSFPNSWENTCIECEENCEQCSMLKECQKCSPSWLVQDGRCVKKCDSNYYKDSKEQFCTYNVEAPKIYFKDAIKLNYDTAAILNSSNIQVIDVDTSRDSLSLVIVEPPINCEMFIVNQNKTRTILKKNDHIRITDVDEGKIVLKYIGQSPFYGSLSVRVNDGQFESSVVAASVNIISLFGPVVTKLESMIVREGGKAILSEDYLIIRDSDNPKSVIVTVVEGPLSGIITAEGEEAKRFTLQELEELQVGYEFSSTKHTSRNLTLPKSSHGTDQILFQVGDGYNYKNFLFQVILVNSERPTPVLIKNKETRVEEHQKIQITKDILQAKSIDTPDENIVYSLSPSTKQVGNLVLIIPLPSTPNGFINDGWIQMDESHLSRPVTSFTQRDINEGRVWYVHSPGDDRSKPDDFDAYTTYDQDHYSNEPTTQEMQFSISDSLSSSNTLEAQTFIVHIDPSAANTKMKLTEGSRMGITVLEGQAVTITSSHLSFTGATSSDHLVYTISHPLGPHEGSLFHIDSPGLELRQFTQSDINDMKIIYMPPFDDIGDEERKISFKFKIANKMKDSPINNSEQKFTITILPMKENMVFLNPNPEILISSLETVEISKDYFVLSQKPDEEVAMFLLEAPRHGSLTITSDNTEPKEFTEETETTLNEVLHSKILYSNDGSSFTSDSALFLVLSHSSEATTKISFKIKLEDNIEPKPHGNATFTMAIDEGQTKMISYKVLHFTDLHSDDDELVYTLSSQPTYGDLLISNPLGQIKVLNQTHKLKQGDITAGKLSYSSTKEIGLKSVTETMIFNVTDPNNNALTNQILKIVISPVDNQPPFLTKINLLRVQEGSSVTLPFSLIEYMDLDTPLEDLRMVIDAPPTFGYLTNAQTVPNESRRRTVATMRQSEYQLMDLIDGKISYVQSQHKHQEPTEDSFVMHLTDGNNASQENKISIKIEPTNDESPVILGEQVSVERGGTVIIQNLSLFISDMDTVPQELQITIIQPPQHGTLHKKNSKTSSFKESNSIIMGESFTFWEILKDLVFYSHDGSKINQDFMEIAVTDGKQETGGILEFLVRAQVVKTPKLTSNLGLSVGIGQTILIQPSHLSATDEDSSINDLKYVLTSTPQLGKLELYNENHKQWQTLIKEMGFTQKDINLGRVRYKQINGKNLGSEEQISFHLKDTEGNMLLDQVFDINVEIDQNPPNLTVLKPLIVRKMGSASITVEFLSATDPEIDPMTIRYKLLQGPQFGIIEQKSSGSTKEQVKSWTQEDLELMKISYLHSSLENVTSDAFQFSISDGTNTARSFFNVTIVHIDEIPPFLFITSFKVQEGSTKNLTRYEIRAEDPDTTDDKLLFEIKDAPKYGEIRINSKSNSNLFTMLDIDEGRISYIHNGDSTQKDSFTLVLSDQTNEGYLYKENEVPIIETTRINIEILPVNGGTPIISTNRGVQYLEQFDDRVMTNITNLELKVSDADTPPDQIMFKITEQPKYGVIRLHTNVRPISTFTQEMIDDGNLYYELTNFDQSITEDSFVFDVNDNSSNLVPLNAFHLQWSWTHMTKTTYQINEPDGAVQIFIRKTGNLNVASTVTCHVQNRPKRMEIPRESKSKEENFKSEKDFLPINMEVYFSPGTTEKYCELAIVDDEILEHSEQLIVKLEGSKSTLIGNPMKSVVEIIDPEDQPSFTFQSDHYRVNESDGFVFVPIERTGDITIPAFVMCLTRDKNAFGADTSIDAEKGNFDYIKKNNNKLSKVVFPPRMTLSTCDIKLVDDSLFELDEHFELVLVEPSAGKVGTLNKVLVTINGPNDLSYLGFKHNELFVNENAKKVRIHVTRKGSDLNHPASVWCASKVLNPGDATANLDFVPFSKEIVFVEGQGEAVFSVNIIDDIANPRYEGPKRFKVFMSSSQNASIDVDRSEIIVTITDDEDIPKIQFEFSDIKVRENETFLQLPIIRSGDLSKVSTVQCFTRQRSAKGGIDFIERPNSKNSTVTFPIGVTKVDCEITILDDLLFEKKEEFIVKLSSPDSPSSLKPSIGSNRITRITLLDAEDKPKITFENTAYSVTEPTELEKFTETDIVIMRLGDYSKLSKVRLSSQDASAVGGSDFQRFYQELSFQPGEKRINVKINILHNPSKRSQVNKFFKLILGPEQPINGGFGLYKTATVSILDYYNKESAVLPTSPVLVSLLHYDNAKEHYRKSASPGYPLMCIPPCIKQHPEYSNTKHLCKKQKANKIRKINYAWEVAVPEGEGLTAFHRLVDSTVFANSSTNVLDSMYFSSQFRVRCIIQPELSDSSLGIPIRSNTIQISSSNNICGQNGRRMVKNQAFKAKLTYINSTDSFHPNSIHIGVEIRHNDGMIPLISTLPLHNVRYLLTDELYRAQHSCSNLLPSSAFMSEESKISDHSGSRPYQWDFNLREMKTINFYKHLNMTTCTWKFHAWYSMSELVDRCGGQIVSDFQVGSNGQSFLTVRVPFYLSQVYASSVPGWTALDHRTELSVSLYYSTLLWNQGLHTKPSLTAKIQITRVFLDTVGRLVVELTTEAKFRGQFVMKHKENSLFVSTLIAPDDYKIKFNLELVWTAATWDGPKQVWKATSDYALKDYTGTYLLQLIPCTVHSKQAYEYSDSPECTSKSPVNFSLPLTIQQIQPPVPLAYTLNTDFQLMDNPETFLEKPNEYEDQTFHGSFGVGQKVYGKVLWHPNQDLHSAYQLIIQKVFICSGKNGYIPKYDPTGETYDEGPLYGCIKNSKNLSHRFLLLDRQTMHSIDSNLTASPLNAAFANDLDDLQALNEYPGVDGFVLETDGLYQFGSGMQWYLQVLYTIGPNNESQRHRRNDEAMQMPQMLDDNATSDMHIKNRLLFNPSKLLSSIHTQNGTNMRGFMLQPKEPILLKSNGTTLLLKILYAAVPMALVMVIILILIIIKKHKTKNQGHVVVVRSLKNERAEARRKDEFRISDRSIKGSVSPVTLNSESNLQTIKVKTLAVTVRNNLEEDGTEV